MLLQRQLLGQTQFGLQILFVRQTTAALNQPTHGATADADAGADFGLWVLLVVNMGGGIDGFDAAVTQIHLIGAFGWCQMQALQIQLAVGGIGAQLNCQFLLAVLPRHDFKAQFFNGFGVEGGHLWRGFVCGKWCCGGGLAFGFAVPMHASGYCSQGGAGERYFFKHRQNTE